MMDGADQPPPQAHAVDQFELRTGHLSRLPVDPDPAAQPVEGAVHPSSHRQVAVARREGDPIAWRVAQPFLAGEGQGRSGRRALRRRQSQSRSVPALSRRLAIDGAAFETPPHARSRGRAPLRSGAGRRWRLAVRTCHRRSGSTPTPRESPPQPRRCRRTPGPRSPPAHDSLRKRSAAAHPCARSPRPPWRERRLRRPAD